MCGWERLHLVAWGRRDGDLSDLPERAGCLELTWRRGGMTTATLERKAKLEPIAAPPEPIHPCRNQFLKLLAEHSAVVDSISDFEGKLSRAQLDLDHAIDSDNDEAIDRHQGQASIYNVKLSAKKMVLAKLLINLP